MKHVLCVALALAVSAGCGGDDEQREDKDDSQESDAGSPGSKIDKDASSPTDAGGFDAAAARNDGGATSSSDASTAKPDARVSSDASTRGDARTATATRDGGASSGPSSGCGKPVTAGVGSFTKKTIRANDRDRTYHVFVPEGYQPTRRYPVVFRFHGSTGDGLSGGLGIEDATKKDTIIVGGDGLNKTWSAGATDLALFDAMVAAVGDEYCVDLGRLFAYGFSAGAGFSEYLSCVRGDTLRGVAAVEGYDWGRGRNCEGPVAAWLLHDGSDQSAPIAGGRAARDHLLEQNGCTMESEPAGQDCVRYKGCTEGHPVVWCETNGMGHNIRGDYAPHEVWKFFSALP